MIEQRLMGDDVEVDVDYQPSKRIRNESFDFAAPVQLDDKSLADLLCDETLPLIYGDDTFDNCFLKCVEQWKEDDEEEEEEEEEKEEVKEEVVEIDPEESLLKTGKVFVPTEVGTRLSNRTKPTGFIDVMYNLQSSVPNV